MSGKYSVMAEPKWPFRMSIQDGDRIVVTFDRCAYSTRANTIDDVRSGVGFKFSERVAIADSVAQQEREITRIVSCVNACEGINPEAIPAVVEALRELLKETNQHAEGNCPKLIDAVTAARSALALVRAR